MKSKKVLGVFYGSLETYTRYSLVTDKKQKKKGLRCFLWKFMSNLVEGGHESLNFFKGAIFKKVWEILLLL